MKTYKSRTLILSLALLCSQIEMQTVYAQSAAASSAGSVVPTQGSVKLLIGTPTNPSNGSSAATIATSNTPGGEFMDYFSDFLSWILSISIGIAVFWVVVSGVMIMVGKNEEGKQHMMWSIGGVVALLAMSMILRMINSIFFV